MLLLLIMNEGEVWVTVPLDIRGIMVRGCPALAKVFGLQTPMWLFWKCYSFLCLYGLSSSVLFDAVYAMCDNR